MTDLHLETSRNKQEPFAVNSNWQLLTTSEMASKEASMKSSFPKATAPLTISARDKERVSVQLTPAQIYKIAVSPSVIDFGEVC